MNQKRLPLILSATFILSACNTTWVRPPGVSEHNFQYDYAQCQALANIAAPTVTAPIQQPTTSYHSGTLYGLNGNTTTYSGITYNSGNSSAALGAAFANLGASIRQSNIIESCLISKGYKKSTPQPTSPYVPKSQYPVNAPPGSVYTANIPSVTDHSAIRDTQYEKVIPIFDVKIRKSPNIGSDIVTNYQKDKELIAKKETDDWIMVETPSQEYKGWVHKKWVKKLDINAPSPEDSKLSSDEKLKTIWPNVTLQEKPSDDARVITVMPNDTVVTLESENQSWYLINFNGVNGWVRKTTVIPID
tara:strand:- start:367 stop:1275 length:909 start_codon:yes stop_codon:yes gene_type:complete